MRLHAIFALATVSALLAGACGSAFTSKADNAAGSAGQSGVDTSGGGDVTAGASGSHAAAGGDAASGTAGATQTQGGSAGTAGVSGGSGGAATCSDPATDCPATGTSCLSAVCKAKRCATTSAAAGTACSDHSGRVCDGGGACVECVKTGDCPASLTTCKSRACDTATDTCKTTKAAIGTACTDSGGAVCDATGACVSTHCMDATQDADETDVDCGGSCGATCKDSGPQQKCKGPEDCVSATCTSGLCHAACSATCTGSCQSCSVPGKIGACTALPPSVDDAKNFCFMMAVCDATGGCTTALSKAHFGDACAQDSDCYNGSCGAGLCRLKTGDPCGEDAACKSGRCAAHVCVACSTGPDCASGMCNAGTCLLPPGYVCAGNADCVTAAVRRQGVRLVRRAVHDRGLPHSLLQEQPMPNLLRRGRLPAGHRLHGWQLPLAARRLLHEGGQLRQRQLHRRRSADHAQVQVKGRAQRYARQARSAGHCCFQITSFTKMYVPPV